MNQFETLRRRLHLIRLTDKPYLYLTKAQLITRLRGNDLKAVAERTIERDIQEIKNQYGIHIRADRRKGGYYLDLPADEDLADFRQFIELLERRERLEFLTSAIDQVRHVSRYLQLEQHPQMAGTDHLSVLWEALQTGRCVAFRYQKFSENPDSETLRRVEPSLLFEYRNRWYLDCYDLTAHQPRTFGLDRLHNLTLTDQPIHTARNGQRTTDRRHVIGVTSPADAEPERVVLRVQATEANYLKTLPMHSSQQIIQETGDFTDFALTVILNHELEREVLAFGELVEVLEPIALREKIRGRVSELLQQYEHRNLR